MQTILLNTVKMHSGSNTMNFALAWMAPKIRRAFLVTTNVADRDNKTFEACDDVIGALIQWDKEHAPQ